MVRSWRPAIAAVVIANGNTLVNEFAIPEAGSAA